MIKTLIKAAMLLCASHAFAVDIQEGADRFAPFGSLHIYRGSAQPRHLTLFISGDGGWNRGVIDMAKSLAEPDGMVVGIDITHYIRQLDASKENCTYSAAHFEELSHYLQKKYHFPRYTLPVLAGYSSGATLVYATVAQSPPNTFAGGISMGFCPDLKTAKPLCKGSGMLSSTHDPRLGYVYAPVPFLAARLYVLQGNIDQVCSTPDTRTFIAKVKGAELVELSGVGHGFSVQRNWMPQLRQTYQKIAFAQEMQASPQQVADELRDLPLVVLPATGKNDALTVMISGDGGWASIDKQVAEALNKDGVAVVGVNSLEYFWEKKTPDIAGKDLVRILEHYGKAWSAKNFILVGYSSGADTLPFMVSRLSGELKSRVQLVALLGPGKEANFEFHVSDWLFSADGAYSVAPEVQKLKGTKVLCVYGEDEATSACSALNRSDFKVIEMKGGHHFGGDYAKLAQIILEHSR